MSQCQDGEAVCSCWGKPNCNKATVSVCCSGWYIPYVLCWRQEYEEHFLWHPWISIAKVFSLWNQFSWRHLNYRSRKLITHFPRGNLFSSGSLAGSWIKSRQMQLLVDHLQAHCQRHFFPRRLLWETLQCDNPRMTFVTHRSPEALSQSYKYCCCKQDIVIKLSQAGGNFIRKCSCWGGLRTDIWFHLKWLFPVSFCSWELALI